MQLRMAKVAQAKRVSMVEDPAGDHWESGVIKALGPHRHALAERIVGVESIYEKAECLRLLRELPQAIRSCLFEEPTSCMTVSYRIKLDTYNPVTSGLDNSEPDLHGFGVIGPESPA